MGKAKGSEAEEEEDDDDIRDDAAWPMMREREREMARVCGRGIERESADGIERESAMGSSESLRPGLRSSGSLRRGRSTTRVERESATGVRRDRLFF